MILKVSIVAVYIVAIVRLCLKWRRCAFVMMGNEMILLLPFFPLALLLPAQSQVLAIRAAVQVSLWGICFFWHTLFPREMWRVVRCVGIFMLLLPAADYICCKFFNCPHGIPLVHIYLVACCYYITFRLWGRSERFPKNLLSIEKILLALNRGILFSVASAGIACLAFYIQMGEVLSWLLLLALSAIPLLVLSRFKPHCMLLNEKMAIKKKAYVLGKSLRNGDFLEDDGGILNECVVEDARIIYAIMVLFEKERLYLKPDIKLIDIAKRIGTNKTYLSRALNTRLSKNFCQFVNHYRIREACIQFIKDPGVEMRPLAEQCGFSSQSNFSIVFKYNTGFTPGDWQRMIKAKLINNEKINVDDYLL